jgi:CRISPR-associated protein Cmr3
MWILIEPNDVLLFRDARPFAAGQSFVARSSFPPHPQTMQGALRTAIMEANEVDFRRYNNENDSTYSTLRQALGNHRNLGELQLRGPFVCRLTDGKPPEILVPLPRDVQVNKRHELVSVLQPSRELGNRLHTRTPFDDWQPLVRPDPNADLPEADPGKFEYRNYWLTTKLFGKYLDGKPLSFKGLIPQSQLFESESHLGLGISATTRTAVESMLYRAEFTRPYNKPVYPDRDKETEPDQSYRTALLLEQQFTQDVDEALYLSDNGYLTLGGEGRFAAVRQSSDFTYPFEDKRSAMRLKLVLLTPAYFSGGWQPSDTDWSPWLENARLVSIAAAEPQVISGWDIARGQAKPLYRYMPAGSVYYFESADGTNPVAIKRDYLTESRPDESETYRQQAGFGVFAAGTWTYLD